jgi:type I restriction enzyme S subunit
MERLGWDVRARIRHGELHPELPAWHANGFGHWFEANGKQSVDLASISLRTTKQLPVPVPPRDEQEGVVREIEDRLAETARLRQALLSAQALADALGRSILAEAFAGRLVPQDPSDEPASELLVRIRAERPPTSRRRAARR